MIINNKSIKGIYRYNSNVEFEPGDFVLDSEVLYKVLQTTKGNIPRTSPDYFEVYVGNNCTSLEEYKKGAMKKDCVLSAVSLDSILSSYMSGYNEQGLISNRITSDLKIISSSFASTENISAYTNPLDAILCKNDLNNAIFNVDPNSEVEKILPRTDGETGIRYVLRQYTYIDSDSASSGDPSITRIQELTKISNLAVTTLYRYVISSDGSFSISGSTTWMSNGVDPNFQKELSQVRGYYLSEIEKYRKLQLVMSNNFRFKSLDIPSNSSRIEIPYGKLNSLVKSDETLDEVPTTFTISTVDIQGFLRVHDVTVELGTLLRAKTAVSYKVGCSDSDIVLSVSFDDKNNNVIFSLSSGNSKAIFQSCYYQQFVKDIDSNVILSKGVNQVTLRPRDFPGITGIPPMIYIHKSIQIDTLTVKGTESRKDTIVVNVSDIAETVESSGNTYTVSLSPNSDLGCDLSFSDGYERLTIRVTPKSNGAESNITKITVHG